MLTSYNLIMEIKILGGKYIMKKKILCLTISFALSAATLCSSKMCTEVHAAETGA